MEFMLKYFRIKAVEKSSDGRSNPSANFVRLSCKHGPPSARAEKNFIFAKSPLEWTDHRWHGMF
jgi:hypothetical protein